MPALSLIVLSEQSDAFVAVSSFLLQVDVCLVSDDDAVASWSELQCRGVGFVAISQADAVEESSDGEGHGVLEAV